MCYPVPAAPTKKAPGARIRAAVFSLGFLLQLGFMALWSGPGMSSETIPPPRDNPEKLFILPAEIDFDSGADNGNAVIARLLPLNTISLNNDWQLINAAIFVIADAPGGVPGKPGNPDPVPGPNTVGLGDFIDALFFSRTQSNGFIWGVGPIMSFPIASDDKLGSGKWSAGPAVRIAYNSGPWHFGMLAGNLSSFAGDADRADINQLLVRGLIRRKLNKGWFLKYSPIITANWNAESDQRWLIPLGGGIGKNFKLFSKAAAFSIEAYSNVIKPDGAPDSMFRIALTLPIPRAFR